MTIDEVPMFPKHLGPMTLTDALVLLPSIIEDDPELASIVATIEAQDAFRLLLIMSACQQRADAINAETEPQYIDSKLDANIRELNRDHHRWIFSDEYNPKRHTYEDGSPLR